MAGSNASETPPSSAAAFERTPQVTNTASQTMPSKVANSVLG